MKEGDKLLIAYKSLNLIEILLDYIDSQPASDTTHPQLPEALETFNELMEAN